MKTATAEASAGGYKTRHVADAVLPSCFACSQLHASEPSNILQITTREIEKALHAVLRSDKVQDCDCMCKWLPAGCPESSVHDQTLFSLAKKSDRRQSDFGSQVQPVEREASTWMFQEPTCFRDSTVCTSSNVDASLLVLSRSTSMACTRWKGFGKTETVTANMLIL